MDYKKLLSCLISQILKAQLLGKTLERGGRENFRFHSPFFFYFVLQGPGHNATKVLKFPSLQMEVSSKFFSVCVWEGGIFA